MSGERGKMDEQTRDIIMNPSSSVVAAAHELKSPLTLIRQLAIDLASDDKDFDARQKTILKRIVLTSEKYLKLTSDLTRCARICDDYPDMFKTGPINLVNTCLKIKQEISPLFEAYNKCLEVDKRRVPLMVIANSELLEKIIYEFCNNALNYTNDSKKVTIKLSNSASQKTARVNVRDYGPMLPSTAWKILTTCLGTSPQPLQARPESSGLGLYLAEIFAEKMGAKIGVTRHRDGMTFFIELKVSTQMELF